MFLRSERGLGFALHLRWLLQTFGHKGTSNIQSAHCRIDMYYGVTTLVLSFWVLDFMPWLSGRGKYWRRLSALSLLNTGLNGYQILGQMRKQRLWITVKKTNIITLPSRFECETRKIIENSVEIGKIQTFTKISTQMCFFQEFFNYFVRAEYSVFLQKLIGELCHNQAVLHKILHSSLFFFCLFCFHCCFRCFSCFPSLVAFCCWKEFYLQSTA